MRTIVHIETKMLITCHFRTKGMRNKTSFYCQPLSWHSLMQFRRCCLSFCISILNIVFLPNWINPFRKKKKKNAKQKWFSCLKIMSLIVFREIFWEISYVYTSHIYVNLVFSTCKSHTYVHFSFIQKRVSPN